MPRVTQDMRARLARLRRAAVDDASPRPVPSLLEWGVAAYQAHVQALLRTHPRQEALELAVGGQWGHVGPRLMGALVLAGLKPGQSIVDVGCGSGRLATRLQGLWHGRYLGVDVVPELIAYAREQTPSPDFQFETITRLSLPAAGDSADIVCFFSVLTHLPHEQSFVYLKEARRVLRPGGRILVSFLEFAEPSHWAVFSATVDSVYEQRHHNQFMHRDDLRVWCDHLGLEVARYIGGQESGIPVLDGLTPTGELTTFGQSLAILTCA
jgi:ubiquinone/menaquinone biosynthesis C-methylase UbiE